MVAWRRMLCLLVLVSAPAAAQDAVDRSSALQHYYTANGLLQRGLHELALGEYETFLEAHAQHEKAPVARYGMALCLVELGRHHDAIVVLEPAMGNPDLPYATESRLLLAQAHLARGDLAAAVVPLEAIVVETEADHALLPDAWSLLVEVYSRREVHDRVIKAAEVARERWPDHANVESIALRQGLSALALDDLDMAVACFEHVRQRYPDGALQARATLALAQALHRTSDPDRAAAHYRAVIDGGDTTLRPDARYGLALLMNRSGNDDEALAQLERFVNESPEHERAADVYRLAGRILHERKSYGDAEDCFARAAELEPDRADESTLWAAKGMTATDRAADAIAGLRKAIEASPNGDLVNDLRYELALALLRTGATDEALTPLRAIVAAQPPHRLAPDALYLEAVAEHRRSDYAACLATCQRFEAAYPGHARSIDVAILAVESASLTDQHDEAIARSNTFVTQHGDHGQAQLMRFRLGMGLYHTGVYDDAERELLTAVGDGDVPAELGPAFVALGEIAFAREDWPLASERFDVAVQKAGDDADPTVRLKLGIARLRAGDPAGALSALDDLIIRAPDRSILARAHFERGQALLAAERPEEAAAAFDASLALNPSPTIAALAYEQLGGIALANGLQADAAAAFRAAATSDSADASRVADRLYQSGLSLLAAAEYEAAAATFEEVAETEASRELGDQAAAQRAIATARLGQPDAALAMLEALGAERRAALDDALRARLLYEEAWCLRALDRADEAERTYRRLLEETVDDRLAKHARLELAELVAAGETPKNADEAETLLGGLIGELTVEDGSMRQTALYQYAHLASRRDDHEAAAARWTTFLDAYPDSEHDLAAHLMAGEALFQVERYREAAPHFADVASRDKTESTGGAALLRLGDSLAALQSWEESEAAFSRFLEQHADSALWYQAEFGRGWARENRGRMAEARSAYTRVVEQHDGPTAARAQFQIGECLFTEERYDEAAVALLRVDILFDYPEWSAAALYEAGRCFRAMGDERRAREQFEAVVERHPESRWSKLASNLLADSATRRESP